MQETKTIDELTRENLELKRKLNFAQSWMEREVKSQIHNVAKRKVGKMTENLKSSFLNENIEEMISKRIVSFFGELLLLNAPKWTIEAITTSEINYYNMKKNPAIDGFSVVSGLHKWFDLFIESFITKGFRKFAKKNKQTILRVNDPIEKSLNLVVNKGYILSTGRLYALLKMIRSNEPLHDYAECFKSYLMKYVDLNEAILSDEFFDRFTELNKSEVLSSKRHKWTISTEDTEIARKYLIGDFEDKDSILFKLLESQTVII